MNKTQPYKSALNYNESSWSILAGLRFVLAGIVLVLHLKWFVPTSGLLANLTLFGGRAAVVGFLLISGVSIGHSLSVQPDGYIRRRFLRIYPLYFIALCFTAILTIVISSPYNTPQNVWVAAHWKTTVANFFFLQGFATIPIPFDFPVWTISVEVFFYALAPMLKRARLASLLVLIGISMLSFVFTHKLWLLGYAALRYIWPWLTGFIFATRGRPRTVAILGLLGVIAVKFNRIDTGEPLGWVNYAVVVLIVLVAGRAVVPSSVRGVLNFLGEQSYPLYLFHVPLCLTVYRYMNVRSPWVLIVAVLGAVVAVQYVFDYWLKNIFWKPLVSRVTETFFERVSPPSLETPPLLHVDETLRMSGLPGVLGCNGTEDLGVDSRKNV